MYRIIFVLIAVLCLNSGSANTTNVSDLSLEEQWALINKETEEAKKNGKFTKFSNESSLSKEEQEDLAQAEAEERRLSSTTILVISAIVGVLIVVLIKYKK